MRNHASHLGPDSLNKNIVDHRFIAEPLPHFRDDALGAMRRVPRRHVHRAPANAGEVAQFVAQDAPSSGAHDWVE
jgi:hypothetical protein